MSVWLKLLDYFFLLRPTQFFPLWITFVCGVIAASTPDLFSLSHLPYYPLLLYSLNGGAIFIFNQIADQESDALNQKLFLLSEKHLPISTAWIEAIGLTMISVWLSMEISYAFFAIMLLGSVFGLLYSFARFMSHPVLSIFVNGVGGVLAYCCGYFAINLQPQEIYWQVIFESLPFGLAWASISILVAIPDIKGDKAFGKNTFPVLYGLKPSFGVALGLNLLTLILSFLTQNIFVIFTVGITAGASALPFFNIYFKNNFTIHSSQKTVKIAFVVLALSSVLFYPVFVILLASNFFLSKYYYKKRFKLNYPNLS